MFAAAPKEKQRLRDESAAYRLKETDAKFSSTFDTAALLAQQTVGLVSKEEFARRRQRLEAGEVDDAAPAAEAAPAPVEKKRKKKKERGALSFAMDDDDEGEEVFEKPKKKANPAVGAVLLAQKEPKEAATAKHAVKPAAKEPEAPTPYPSDYTCMKEVGAKQFEVQLEVMASASIEKTKVTRISAQCVAIVVQGSDRSVQGAAPESNAVLVSFLRAILGGKDAVACDIVRGQNAPVKTVRVGGLESIDTLYTRLLAALKSPPAFLD
jgi:hypothetical protein